MNNGNLIIKKINLLASKANELLNQNKIITGQISHYKKLFDSNKKHISEYFNIITQSKIETKNSNSNKNRINNINKIKDILIGYNSELKLSNDCIYKSEQNLKEKLNVYKNKLITQTVNLTDKRDKISEDNFLYNNAVKAKENLIQCLRKDLKTIKGRLYEDVKHIYLNHNSVFNTNNSTSNNKANKSALFEEGEKVIDYLLREEKRKFYINMKQRSNTRQKYGKMNIKKNALSDLVTSFSFINETEITPSLNNNIFQLLNKKIGGVVKNYEKYFNNDIIDENYFIFLPFEFEINKDEINELMQTDITLPNNEFKVKTKLNKNNNENKKVPKLDFLQIEFNKEKVEFSQSDENTTEENINNNNFIDKNKNMVLDLQIEEIKGKIRSLKKSNKKLKNIINDFNKFQDKIRGKFEIYEKKIMKEKEELKIKESDLIE